MSEALIALVPTYGLGLLAVIVFLSCLALPVPTSLVMLTSGSFIASGDLDFTLTLAAALGGAVSGDQVGYLMGRKGGNPLLSRLANTGDRRALLTRAGDWIEARGGVAVFLSRWLFSPLGPYVNFIAGTTRLSWYKFTLWGISGECVWVAVCVGLGMAFADNVLAVADIAGNASGVMAGGVVTLFLGLRVWQVLRRKST